MKQNWQKTPERGVQSWEYAKKFKFFLLSYGQTPRFGVKYNKTVNNITATTACDLQSCYD